MNFFSSSPVRANTRLFVIVYTLPVCVSVRVCVCVGAPKFGLIESDDFIFFPHLFRSLFEKKLIHSLIIMFFSLHPKSQTTKTCAILCPSTLPRPFKHLFDDNLILLFFFFVVSRNYKQTNSGSGG